MSLWYVLVKRICAGTYQKRRMMKAGSENNLDDTNGNSKEARCTTPTRYQNLKVTLESYSKFWLPLVRCVDLFRPIADTEQVCTQKN